MMFWFSMPHARAGTGRHLCSRGGGCYIIPWSWTPPGYAGTATSCGKAGVWTARAFRGTAWTRMGADKSTNRLNAYRVLLTRARYHTFIWVPRGDGADPTRDPNWLDDTAAFLFSCGACPGIPPALPGSHAAPAVPRHQDLFA